MKKIFLLSDTHAYSDEAILHHASEADEIWHAGDWLTPDLFLQFEKLNKTIRCVYGNVDGADVRKLMPEINRFSVEGVNVMIMHITGFPGRYNPKLAKEISSDVPDLLVGGHSHILKVMRDPSKNNMLFVNPGAAGKHGFHLLRTALRFQLNNGKVEKMEAIEFGKRGEL